MIDRIKFWFWKRKLKRMWKKHIDLVEIGREVADKIEKRRDEPKKEASHEWGILAEKVAKMFHEYYELLAPTYGWKTRAECRTRWEDLPEKNRGLMISTAAAVLHEFGFDGIQPLERIEAAIEYLEKRKKQSRLGDFIDAHDFYQEYIDLCKYFLNQEQDTWKSEDFGLPAEKGENEQLANKEAPNERFD